MPTFKDAILEEVGKETIEAIVIGEFGWHGYRNDGKPAYKHVIGKLLSWEEASPILDYEYESGHGATGACQAITAWTPDHVYFIGTYDGRTWVDCVPRNPLAYIPSMVGDG